MKRFVSITLAVALIVLYVGVADAQNKRAIAPQTSADKAETVVTSNEPGTTRQSAANPRELAEDYIAAVLAGNTRAAAAFATGTVTTKKRLTSKEWMDEFRELLGEHSLDIETVRVKDMAGSALAVSRRIKLTKPHPDVGDTVRLVIQMSVDGGGWVIRDVDLWSESDAERALARFNQQHPDARDIPAVRGSSTATSKVDALKHAKVRDAVEKAFETRQQQQRAELAKLQQRLRRIQDLIESRERIKDKIIDRRVEELLNPALQWESKPPGTSAIGGLLPAGMPARTQLQKKSAAAGVGKSALSNSGIIGQDPGEMIYNDRLKRFKFRLEKTQVSIPETAMEFRVRYDEDKNPKLTGVWADPRTNSIVVIGPPEAEQAIRDALAKSEAIAAGTGDNSLEAQQTELQRERKDLLETIAGVKLDIIDAEATEAAGEKSKPYGSLNHLNRALEALQAELDVVERKLDVIEKSIEGSKINGGADANRDSPESAAGLDSSHAGPKGDIM